MRILMIGGNIPAMLGDVLRNSNGASVLSSNHAVGRVTYADGTEVWCRVIRGMVDTHMLRGLRFDLIMEHPSYRGGVAEVDALRAMVLRA